LTIPDAVAPKVVKRGLIIAETKLPAPLCDEAAMGFKKMEAQRVAAAENQRP
jgi:hypothetical protein